MNNRYLKIPLNLGDVVIRKDLNDCTLQNSIDQHICLMMTTHFGESRFDDTYGAEIWDLDFSIIPSTGIWTERLAKSIANSLQAHEARLSDISVRVEIKEEVEIIPARGVVRLRKKIVLMTSGYLTNTREPMEFRHELFLNPLSLD